MNGKLLIIAIVLGLLLATGAQAGLDTGFDYVDAFGMTTHGGAPGDIMDFHGYAGNNSSTDALYINQWYIDDIYSVDFALNGITFDNASWISGEDPGYIAPPYILLPDEVVYGKDLFTAHAEAYYTDPGTYQGQFVISGGDDEFATDELARMDFTLEVVPDYEGFTVSLMNPNQSAGPGDTATYSTLYDNSSGDRAMYIYTVWVSASTPAGDLDLDFNYGWPSLVDSGSSASGDVFNWTVLPGADETLRSGYSGAYGGYYEGDLHVFATGQWTLDVQQAAVPEPSSLIAVAFPALMLGLGKLRSKRK